ncbi:SDR family oxidoreductase [Klebsiella pneumoniae]
MKEATLAQIPMKEFGQAEQVADLTVFLAGQDYLTGQVIAIDGGLSM